MNDREKRLFEALSKIAEAANAALKGGGSTSGDEHDDHDEQDHDHDQDGHAHADIGCSIKQVPKRLQTKAAETA